MSTVQSATALGRHATRAAAVAFRPVRAVAFWLGIALPFVALALATTGSANSLTLGVLLAVDATALLVGRDHARPD